MQVKGFISFVLLSATITTWAAIPHLDPEMTAKEYEILLNHLEQKQGYLSKLNQADPLKKILKLGKRNLDWIEAINAKRDAGHKLELTNPQTTRGYPIESPSFSNRKIIENNLSDLKKEMPKEMARVIFGTGSLPSTNPLDDDTFIAYARVLNHIYEDASRWLLEEPYLFWYRMNAKNDIRGYYFLSKEKGLEKKLRHWDKLNTKQRAQYREWLINECFNSEDYDDCVDEFKIATNKEHVFEFHAKYVKRAKQTYQDFFAIQNPRKEVVWSYKDPDVMHLPFTTPKREDVKIWFKTNVEDEYHVDQWHLMIDYRNTSKLAKVVFEPDATPHVNGLGGNVITMDANRPLNEYAVTWAIRHEFGHVLGFPDCYIEFYDDNNEVMINYQLDLSNIMCSRQGHLQTQHYIELKKHYFRAQK